jgi:cobalamin biosynthesis Mg chelatase CobN
VIRSLTLHRALRLGLLIIALVMVSSVASKPAMAKPKSCADLVIADWYDDGRVGKIYPLHCYKEAIAKLPPDVLDYSNAKEEIGRALAFAKQGKPDPGGSDPSPGSTATTATETTTTEPVTSTAQTTTAKTETTTTTSTPTTTTTVDTDTTATVVPATDTSGPSSVPVPLLVLGGLAVLLLAAGSAGYLRRRMNDGDDGPGAPPAAPPAA